MRAAFVTHEHKVELREVASPVAAPNEVVVDVHACGICGSDLHSYVGEGPVPRVCPGHEICGWVAAESPAGEPGTPVVVEPVFACGRCRHCAAGEPNLCRALEVIGIQRHGGFAERVVAPLTSVYVLPPGLDLDTAVLTEPLAVAVHGLGRVRVVAGSEVLVIGGGTIGLLTAFVLARAGSTVTVAARHAHQRDLARHLGAARVVGAERTSVLEAAREHAPSVVFETVGGRAETLDLALEAVDAGGSIVTLGVFSRPLALDPIRFLAKEATLTASMMYSRTRSGSDFATALELLREHGDRLAALVTHRVPLARIDEGFRLASDKRSGAVKVCVDVDRRA